MTQRQGAQGEAGAQRVEHRRPVVNDGQYSERRRYVRRPTALQCVGVCGDDDGILVELLQQTRRVGGDGRRVCHDNTVGILSGALRHELQRLWSLRLCLDRGRDAPG